jgi:hypothetical protein
MSIAQKYDNMGAEMADLVQVTFSSIKGWYPWIKG